MTNTLAQPITAVNWYVSTDPDAGNGPDLAHRWGEEDSLEGNDAQGSVYFPIESPAWHSYNEGYAAGLLIRRQLAPVAELDEIEFMAQALDTLRQPAATATVQLEAFDADAAEEWIGNAFSTMPYNW